MFEISVVAKKNVIIRWSRVDKFVLVYTLVFNYFFIYSLYLVAEFINKYINEII